MIRKYSGGTFAPCGTYVNTKSWEFQSVPREGDRLEGEGTYYRVPLLAVMVLGPLAGLAFILFLPVAVPAVLIYAVARRLSLSIRGRRVLRPRMRG
jgi:hypothetical protein